MSDVVQELRKLGAKTPKSFRLPVELVKRVDALVGGCLENETQSMSAMLVAGCEAFPCAPWVDSELDALSAQVTKLRVANLRDRLEALALKKQSGAAESEAEREAEAGELARFLAVVDQRIEAAFAATPMVKVAAHSLLGRAGVYGLLAERAEIYAMAFWRHGAVPELIALMADARIPGLAQAVLGERSLNVSARDLVSPARNRYVLRPHGRVDSQAVLQWVGAAKAFPGVLISPDGFAVEPDARDRFLAHAASLSPAWGASLAIDFEAYLPASMHWPKRQPGCAHEG